MTTSGLRTFNVLFLCTHNSARSILAEALLNRLGAGRFEAWSAGYNPVAAISPYALALLHKINYNASRLATKPITAIMGKHDPAFDFVIRLSPDRRGSSRTPQFKDNPVIVDWHLPDPCDVMGSSATIAAAYADVFDVLAGRIDVLANLSVAALESEGIGLRLERMGENHLRLAS
ncbi:arsenate reductase ArsC [Asticcacaulis sp. AC402]|uniref:arsenate reductase ArsC n=1 Tax=Asticcacaulis sp. AC402 TaxID=1282361 RepID=UPI0003C40F66|nr:arsenate reductase ArsC [Asticcacaulis sp. AC402]ESQ76000.1 protein tyrosine phosphatase [Asticcacaulis sp. AC402]